MRLARSVDYVLPAMGRDPGYLVWLSPRRGEEVQVYLFLVQRVETRRGPGVLE